MHSPAPLSFFESLRALQRNVFLTLAVSVASFALAYALASNVPVTYEVHSSLMLSMDVRDDTSEFRYDGYYALSAADIFSATVAGLIASPETVVAAYQKAGLPLPSEDASRIVRAVQAEKSAPQLVQISVLGKSAQDAQALSAALQEVLAQKVEEYNEKNDASVVFRAVSSDPWTGVRTAAPLPVALSVFLLVFFCMNMGVLFREALQRGNTH